MRARASAAALVASFALAAGCTTDFTGYHLHGSDAGASDAEAGENAGGTSAGGASAGHAGTISHAGSPAVGGGSPEGGVGGDVPLQGDAGTSGEAGVAASAGGTSVSPIVLLSGTPPSCVALASTCGPDGATSCCTASLVPGGTYERSNQSVAPATVSDFGLDEYEVSVGRFRNFVHVYTQAMTAAGAGKNPNDATDPGWSTDWNARLPLNSTALIAAVECAGGTYTTDAAAKESLPIACISWYEAFAFCIWDGGRLPTEAEWNYAAAGGAEQRIYPWGSATPDDDHAVFQPGSNSVLQTVGAKARLGSGKWGQSDMAGNAWEWNLDVFETPYVLSKCQDCSDTAAAVNSVRVFRGGSTGNPAGFLQTATRNSYDPTKHNAYIGVRCARAP